MPKTVDHQQRRAEISAATWRVIERGGIPAVTLRSVAVEAGVSLGVLAHYFSSKEDIVLDAHRAAYDRALERVVLRTNGTHGLTALRAALLEALPLDPERLVEAKVDIALVGLVPTDEVLRATRAESAATLRRLVLGCLAEARAHGELGDGVDDTRVADECTVLIDGGSVLGLLDRDDPSVSERLTALVDALVHRIGVTTP